MLVVDLAGAILEASRLVGRPTPRALQMPLAQIAQHRILRTRAASVERDQPCPADASARGLFIFDAPSA
jgi:hypothetical protein